MKEIRLIGDIADLYGESFHIEVKNPSEALRAIDANFPGFLKHLDDNKYNMAIINVADADSSRQVDLSNKFDTWSDDEILFILPDTEGEFFGIDIAIAGSLAASVAASSAAAAAAAATGLTVATIAAIAVTVVNIVVAVAVSMAASLIASAIMGSGSDSSDYETPENKPSYLFNGVVNTMKQGGRVPLFYGGPLLIGSMTLSARMVTEDEPV